MNGGRLRCRFVAEMDEARMYAEFLSKTGFVILCVVILMFMFAWVESRWEK